MSFYHQKGKSRSALKLYIAAIVGAWTLAVVISLTWNLYQKKQEMLSIARGEARAAFEKDLVFRRWAAGHGGVYVPVTGNTPPNPYLTHIDEPTFTTPKGRELTLMNPAYMIRQIHEMAREQYGYRGHITSLNPLRPENAPDTWEIVALTAFESGEEEFSSVETVDGIPYLRLMRRITTEISCLKCHASQRYKEGDVRGGASVSVPLESYMSDYWVAAFPLAVGHGVLWFLGLFGIGLGARQVRNRVLEQKKVDGALRKNEANLFALIENSQDLIWSIDEEYKIVTLNSVFRKRIKTLYEVDIAVGMDALDFYPPEIKTMWTERYNRVLKGEPFAIEDRYGPTASPKVLEISFNPILFEGKANGASIYARDITARKRSEESIKQQLEMIDLLNQITYAISQKWNMDSMYRVVLHNLDRNFNLDFAAIYSVAEDLKTLTLSNHVTNVAVIETFFTMEKNQGIPLDHALAPCLKGNVVYIPDIRDANGHNAGPFEGSEIHSVLYSPLMVENKPIAVLVVARSETRSFNSGEIEFLTHLSEHVALAAHQADLFTNLQQTYERLQETQDLAMEQERLNAMGQMASGIAHDINNLLAPITLYTEALLETENDLSDRARKFLTTIRSATGDIENTTTRLREFYRKKEDDREPVLLSVGKLAKDVIDLSRPRWNNQPRKKGIVLGFEADIPVDIPNVLGIESEIREALINLIFNSVDAMPSGGNITLKAHSKNGFVVLEVSDMGNGMNDEQKQKCMEPFFTTKGEGGTGLGLAMVYGVMKRHGGEIEIDSTPNLGTSIRLLFPNSIPHSSESSHSNEPAKVDPMYILCIDDDENVLKALKEILQIDGHDIESTASGEDGIRLFYSEMRREKPFDLVITDLGMPHMDGYEVAKAIKRESNQTPVILLSGWGNLMKVNREMPENIDCVLGKPPKINELRLAIKRLTTKVYQNG